MCDNTALTKKELKEGTRMGGPRAFATNASSARCRVTEVFALVRCQAA